MNISLAFTFCRILGAILLLFAIIDHSYTYFIAVRIVVFTVALWGFYKVIDVVKSKRLGFLLLFYFGSFILFNPFKMFHFERDQWIIIDILFSLFLFTSIFLHESKSAFKILDNFDKERIILRATQIFGIGLILLGGFFTYVVLLTPINIIYLREKGEQTQGNITKVVQHWSSSSDEIEFDSYEIFYSFVVNDNLQYKGHSNYAVSPFENLNEVEFMEKFGSEYSLSKSESELHRVKIYYQLNNPQNNKSLYEIEKSTFDILFLTLLPELLFTFFIVFLGFRTFQNKKIEN